MQRNPLLANVFFRAGLVEAWGTGTLKIIKECIGKFQPQFKEEQEGFVLSIHKILVESVLRNKYLLDDRQVKAMMHLKIHGSIKNGEYQEITGISKSTALRSLNDLLNKGLITKKTAAGRGTEYVLKLAE